MLNRITRLPPLYLALLGGLVAWVILLGIYLSQFANGFSQDQEVWGQFGDYIGGMLNPLFGFAGFVILVYTLYQQRAQISDQKDVSDQQTFETTFFQLLHRFSEVVGDLRYEYRESQNDSSFPLSERGKYFSSSYLSPTYFSPSIFPTGTTPVERETKIHSRQGRQAIRAMFEYGFKPIFKSTPLIAGTTHLDRCIASNKAFYQDTEHELGIYFRTLYHVLKFVDTSQFSFSEKVRYANIARAQLSSYELSMIFYNALWGEGHAGMKPLIEKYGLLKHIKEPHVLNATDLVPGNLYPEVAFSKFTRRVEVFGTDEPQIAYD